MLTLKQLTAADMFQHCIMSWTVLSVLYILNSQQPQNKFSVTTDVLRDKGKMVNKLRHCPP
jgi:hypothetical protein